MKNAINYPYWIEQEIYSPKSLLLQKSKRVIIGLYAHIGKGLLSVRDLMEDISYRQHYVDTSRFDQKLGLINSLNNKKI